jgi:mandelate racemase
MTQSNITIRAVSATPVSVPLNRPLGTSSQAFRSAPLLLLNLETEEGITGHAYAFCYLESVALSLQSIVSDVSVVLKGHRVAPLDISRKISHYFKLTGLAGPLLMVASAIDTAAWDALAVAAGLPLVQYLGSDKRPLRAYNSCGLSLIDAQAAADEAEELLSGGFKALKLRMGRPLFADDIDVLRAVRKRISDDILIMVDFNQGLTFAQAMQYCPALDGEGVYWIEEPIRHDDFKHCALIAQASKTPIQLGENLVGMKPLADALTHVASDYLMFDLDRIGGVSGWGAAAGLAAAFGREVSTHLFPEVSAHLLASTPTMHWLEYVDWAEPLLQQRLSVKEGYAIISDGAGNGLRWDPDAVAKYRII